MNTPELFQISLSHMNDIVSHIESSRWQASTPCAPWDLRQLLNHVTYEWLWAPELFADKTVKEVGDKFEGDVLGSNATQSYRVAAKRVSKAVASLDLKQAVHLSYADVSAKEYLNQLSIEALIHGWDMAKTIGYGDKLPVDAVDALREVVAAQRSEIESSGMYGHKLKVLQGDDAQTKLLALLGRQA